MITKFAFLILSMTFISHAYGAESYSISIDDIDAVGARPTTPSSSVAASAASSREIARITGIRADRVSRVHEALGADFENNINDVMWYRRFFRKAANITEALGNGLLYLGSGASAIAAAGTLIFPTAVPYILFSGTACFGAHLTLIGIAKCSAREAGEREQQLGALAGTVGFHITSVLPTVTDDVDDIKASHA